MQNLILTFILSFVIINSSGQNNMKLVCGTGHDGFKDGKTSELNKPIRMTPYKQNSIIFADINNHAIRTVTLDGKVTTIAGGPYKQGYLDGPAEIAKFKSPHGVAYDQKTGKIYVASASNHVIRLLTPGKNGEYEVSTFAGVPEKSGFQDGATQSALFNSPHAIVISPDGSLIVVDIGNARVRKIKDGEVSTLAGTGNAGSKLTELNKPAAVLVHAGYIWIADLNNHQIKIIPLP